MIQPSLNKSSAPSHYAIIWFIASASCLFAALIIAESMRQGRLSLPATYDDVGYFNDAARRLQILYDDGVISCLASLIHNPPHSPFATLVPFLGFSLFGIKDWAPAAVNVIWVALLLYFIRLVIPEVSRWAYAIVAASTLAWPLTGIMVVECRPDIYAALLMVMGVVQTFRAPFLHATTRHIALVAVLFGAALLAKPSMSPVTLLVYGASISIAIAIESRGSLDRRFISVAALRISQCLAITAVVVALYFVFAWRHTYHYIFTVMVSQNELWNLHLSAFDAAGYYLWGSGGLVMMGVWFWITIALVLVDVVLGLLTRRPSDGSKTGLIIVFLFAYALVSIPSVKSPYLGSVVSIFFMTFYVLACSGIIGSLLQLKNYGRWVAVGFCAGLLLTSAAVFDWAWWPLGTISHLTATRRHEIIQRLADYIEAGGDKAPTVFFPVITQFVNGNTLQFELQKRRVKNANIEQLHSLDGQRDALAAADYVVLFDEIDPDILRSFPEMAFYRQVIALVVAEFVL